MKVFSKAMAKETNSQELKKTEEKERDLAEMQELCEKTIAELKDLVSGLSLKILQDDPLNRPSGRYRMPPCIGFPKFSGKNLMGWLYKCEQFFDLDSTPPSARLKLVALHLEGEYLHWHMRYMRMRSSEPTWDENVEAFNARFVELFSDNPIAELKNLDHDGELEDYLNKFDAVMCRVDFRKDFAVSHFVAGLKPEIRYGVLMFHPKTLQDAYRIDKLKEDANLAESSIIDSEMYAVASPENGQINLITVCGGEGSLTRHEDDLLSLKEGIDDFTQKLWEHASCGACLKYQLMTISELFGRKNIHILIDSGSTHNILDADMAEMMGCRLTKMKSVMATLANGEMMECKYVCRGFAWQMQGVQFTSDVLIVPIRKNKMVLGVQWLSTLGDIMWNFQSLRMEIVKDQNKMVLEGTNNSTFEQITEDENQELLHEVPLQRNMHVCSIQDEISPTIQLTIQTPNSSKEVQDSTNTRNDASDANGEQYQRMIVAETFGGKNFRILIDSGCTHNFLDEKVANMMGCELTDSKMLLEVNLVNGEAMHSTKECKGFTWKMQGVSFTADVITLNLQQNDTEMILGVQWLSTLGDILWNFHTLRMEFWKDQKKVVLEGGKRNPSIWLNTQPQIPTLLLSSVETTSVGCLAVTGDEADLIDSLGSDSCTMCMINGCLSCNYIFPPANGGNLELEDNNAERKDKEKQERKYRGVIGRSGNWAAQKQGPRRNFVLLGGLDTAQEAGRAYDQASVAKCREPGPPTRGAGLVPEDTDAEIIKNADTEPVVTSSSGYQSHLSCQHP